MADWHNTLFKVYNLGSGWPRWARYLCTAAIVLATGWVWLRTGIGQPYLLFFLTIFFSSAAFDRGSGFLATVLSALFAGQQLLVPSHPAVKTQDEIELLLFFIIGFAVAWLVEALRTRLLNFQNKRISRKR